jgi:hypothetical protein
MACVEFVADKRTKALFADEVNIGEKIHVRAQARGLLVRPIMHLNVMSPPLIHHPCPGRRDRRHPAQLHPRCRRAEQSRPVFRPMSLSVRFGPAPAARLRGMSKPDDDTLIAMPFGALHNGMGMREAFAHVDEPDALQYLASAWRNWCPSSR